MHTYTPAKQTGMFVAKDHNGKTCGYVSKQSMDDSSGPVFIRYWRQQTQEAGFFVDTELMPMSSAIAVLETRQLPRANILPIGEYNGAI